MTKKILLGMALVASLAACTDDYKDWLTPQVVDQPEKVSFGDGSVTTVGTIDFNSYTEENVKVCSITPPTASDASYKPSFTITLGGEETYDIGADGVMSSTILSDYVIAKFGRRPVERVVDATVSMWLSNGTTTVKTATSDVFHITVIPRAPQISQNYYIVGGPNDWGESAKNKMLKFNHSGKDVYEDPIFTVTFPASEGDTWFAIGDDEACEAIANDNDWSKLLGTTKGNGNQDPTGNLDRRYNLKDDGSFCVPAGGKLIRVTINMMDYSYQIESLNFAEFIYVPGNAQKYNTAAPGMPEWGWTPELAPALRSANFDGIYEGFAYMDGDFKFTKERNWNAEYNYNDFTSYSSMFKLGDGGNINCTEPGYYKLVADVANGSLTATKLTWGLVGPATAGGWDAPSYTVMNYNMAEDCWEITTQLNADKFKFTTNGSWDINLGGDSVDNLWEGGPDLVISEAGTYTIKLYPSRAQSDKIYATIVKQ